MIEQRLAWMKFHNALTRYVPIQPLLWLAFSLIFRIPIFQPVTLILEGALLVLYVVFVLIKPESIRLASPKTLIVLLWLLSVLPLGFLFVLRYAVIPISREADFVWIEWNPRGHFSLRNDLDLANYDDESKECVIDVFAGTLDGNDKTIYGLKLPLVCLIDTGGTLRHLKFKDVNIVQGQNLGSVAKENKGLISYIEVEGSLQGGGYLGGLVGIHRGLIEQSRFEGNLMGYYIAGGMVGLNTGTIQTSQVKGTGQAQANLGGFAGWFYRGVIENCVSDMDLSGAQWVGGIAGKNSSREHYMMWGPIRKVVVLGSLSGINVGVVYAEQIGTGIGTLFGGIIHSEGHTYDEYEGIWYVLDQAFVIPEFYRFDSSDADEYFYPDRLKLDPTIWDWDTESGIPVLR